MTLLIFLSYIFLFGGLNNDQNRLVFRIYHFSQEIMVLRG